ncbi:MAG: glutathionylspermidine synthase family protein [Gemmatimonadetes bacterium]|nr:MAG: glutathionylspermidine synthase family protein [Gemmatimonadota bacterium]
MHRIPVAQRPGLEEAAREHGYQFRVGDGVPHWDETAYYQFTLSQIERDLEKPAEEIDAMCFELLDQSLWDETIYQRLRIPESYWDYVANSWRNRERDLLGRFDFSYDGAGDAKLLEYNADTPTTLYESAVFQWVWLEEAIATGLIPQSSDQSAQIHEYIVEAFRGMGIQGLLHLACLRDIEDDRETVRYLEECAQEAGLETQCLDIKDIGIDAAGRFTDLEDRVTTTLFKLYPWEWIMEEEFGRYLVSSGVHFLEPPWKAVLSNKGLLPLLWESFEGHPNLLPAYFEGDARADALRASYVRKPMLSRQGSNIEIVQDGLALSLGEGPYGKEGHIVQALYPLPEFDGKFPLVGYWMVAGQPAGLSIRESQTLVTDGDANFVPHIILD